MADCQAALTATISLAPRTPLPGSVLADEEEEEEEGGREEERAATPATVEAAVRANQAAAAVEAAREAGELDEYAKAWAAQAVRLGEAAAGSALLRRRLNGGLTPKQLELAVRLALCEVTAARPLPSLAAIERGLRQQTLPGAAELLRQLSVVELLLLLSLKKLGDREAPPPHTLRMVLREYNADFLVSIERGQAPLLTMALLTMALLTMASPSSEPQPQPYP